MLNSNEARTQPCLVPLVTANMQELTSINNLILHPFIKGFIYVHKLARTPDFAQHLPESLPINRVKGRG